MRSFITALTFISLCSCSQSSDYEKQLLARIAKVERDEEYDNNVVLSDGPAGHGLSGFEVWRPETKYYEGDNVQTKESLSYQAIRLNQGKDPATSSNDWKLLINRHPYYFLRDTASAEDLRSLLKHKDAKVRTYAFAALDYRREEGLMEVIISNLGDTSRFMQMTSDYGHIVYPADLMVLYKLPELSSRERSQLLELIDTKYMYLKDARRLLATWSESNQSISF